MTITEHAPSASLAHDVELIRIIRAPATPPFAIKTCPHGTPGLVYQRGEPLPITSIETRSHRTMKVPALFLHGLGPEPSTMSFSGSESLVVQVILKPWALLSAFGIPGSRLGLESLSAPEFDALPFQHALDSLDDDHNITTCAEQFLEARRDAHGRRDTAVESVASAAFDRPCDVTPEQLAERVGLSPRQLQRRFLSAVGCPLKTFLRLRRANLALELIQQDRHASLTEVAYELGYSDQSHFIRDIKEFTWLAPRRAGEALDQASGAAAGFSFL